MLRDLDVLRVERRRVNSSMRQDLREKKVRLGMERSQRHVKQRYGELVVVRATVASALMLSIEATDSDVVMGNEYGQGSKSESSQRLLKD